MTNSHRVCQSLLVFVYILISGLLTSACQTAKQGTDSAIGSESAGAAPIRSDKTSLSYKENELPKVETAFTASGKGVPNGRSSSSAPFLTQTLETSADATYGYSEKNPIKTGPRSGPTKFQHILYLNALRGPNGEIVEYERKGSCCLHEIPGAQSSDPLLNRSILDIYRIRINGSDTDQFLFVDMYESGTLKVPQGFTQRKM